MQRSQLRGPGCRLARHWSPRVALHTEDGFEIDRQRHTLHDDTRHAVAELIGSPCHVGSIVHPPDVEIVLQDTLIPELIARDHEKALLHIPHRAAVRVPIVLTDAIDGAGHARPVGHCFVRPAASCRSASSSLGGPPGRSAVISSDHTTNFARRALPNAVESGQSTASRLRPITSRPTRGVLWRASNVYQRPPT